MNRRRRPNLPVQNLQGYSSLMARAVVAPQSGFSLLAVIVALAVVGGMAATISQMTVRSLRSSKAGSIRQDIEMIKQTILETIDCRRTMNVAPTATMPLTCPAVDPPLRRRNNSLITLGPWTIKVSCTEGAGGHLTVGISRPGVDPITGIAWASLRATGPSGSTIGTDVFGGTEKLCTAYLDPTMACTGKYDIYQGADSGRPLCCRVQEHKGPPPDYVSAATCDANEYIQSGGGSCHDMHAGGPKLLTEHTYMHTNLLDNANNRWITDCHAAQHIGETTPPALDVPSVAYALCCPR